MKNNYLIPKLTFIVLFIPCFCFNQIQSTAIQPNDSVGKDVVVASYFPTYNLDGYELSTFIDGTPSTPNIRRSYIQFDLTGIDKNAIIVDADISLYRYSGHSSPSTEINRVIEAWSEDSVTYNYTPNLSVSDMITTSPAVSQNWHSFDVTDHVQFMVNYPHLNFGWRLKSEDETVTAQQMLDFGCGCWVWVNSTNGTTFRSSDYSNSTYRPKIEISYVFPIEISLNQITHADTPTSSNGSISVDVDKGDGTYYYQWIDGATGTDISGETSSSISGLSPGWYGVEVTDGLGNVSYMAFVVGAKCGEVTIEFQPDGRFIDFTKLMTGTDNNNEPYDDRNLSTASLLDAERRLNISYDYYTESLFRNRLIIPDNINLNSAKQHLAGSYHSYTFGNKSNLITVVESWDEDIVTWNTRPNYDTNNPPILTIPTTTSGHQDVELDLTSLYEGFQDGSIENLGQSLVLDYPMSTTNRRMRFKSQNHSHTYDHPKLVLEIGQLCMEGYSELKRKLDASYTFTKFGVLYFSVNDDYEHTSNTLSIKLFDDQRQEILLAGNEPIVYDDNRVNLDLNSLSLTPDDFYFIEVRLPKGERRFLKFQYKNN